MSLKHLKKYGGLQYSFESLGLTQNSRSCPLESPDNGIHELSCSAMMNIV